MTGSIDLTTKAAGAEIYQEEKMVGQRQDEKPSSQSSDADTVDDPRLKGIKRKIDLRICLVLGCLYTISLLDRVNLPVSLSLCALLIASLVWI